MNDLLPFNALLAHPLSTLRKVVFLGALGIILGAIYPGFLQYQFHTLFARDVLDKIPVTARGRVCCRAVRATSSGSADWGVSPMRSCPVPPCKAGKQK
jgi:hypothetical protein